MRGSSGGISRGWQWAPGRRDWQTKAMVLFFRYTSDLRILPSRYLVHPGVCDSRTRPSPVLPRYRGANNNLQFDPYPALTCSHHHLFFSEHVPRPRVIATLGVTPIKSDRQRVAFTSGHPVYSGPLSRRRSLKPQLHPGYLVSVMIQHAIRETL